MLQMKLYKKSGAKAPPFLFSNDVGNYPSVVSYPLGRETNPLPFLPIAGKVFCENSFAGFGSLLNLVQYFMLNPFWLSANSTLLR